MKGLRTATAIATGSIQATRTTAGGWILPLGQRHPSRMHTASIAPQDMRQRVPWNAQRLLHVYVRVVRHRLQFWFFFVQRKMP